jgi:CheY-like chemotaxis protein
MREHREPATSRLAEFLLSEALVTKRQLDAALEQATQQAGHLADAVVQLGFLSEKDAYAALASATGLHFVDLSDRTPSPLALRLVPAHVALRNGLLPLDESDRILTYAVSRPFDDKAERDVALASGRKPFAVLARRSELLEALDRRYLKPADVDAQPACDRAVDSAAAMGGRDRRLILVVEDDRLTRMLIKLLLEHEGYEVIEGDNGRQAVEIARREQPDLLLIDLLMPEMDTCEAIAHIRRDVSLAALPVIVLTADVGPGVEQRVLEFGADDYMFKPLEAPLLISRVAAAFHRMQRPAA